MYEISEKRLLQISNGSLTNKVMIKQWYPDIFKEQTGWFECNSSQNEVNFLLFKPKTSEQTHFYGFRNNKHGIYNPVGLEFNFISDEDALKRIFEAGLFSETFDESLPHKDWTLNESGNVVNELTTILDIVDGWNKDLTYWNGSGWYKGTDELSRSIIIYKKLKSSLIGYGFLDGEWKDEIEISDSIELFNCHDSVVKIHLVNHINTIGYTSENVTNVDGFQLNERESFFSDTSQWAFFLDTMYSERMGYGGYLIYKNGEFAKKRIAII